MFISNYKTTYIAAIAAICIGMTGTDIITQSLAHADLKEQFNVLDEFGPTNWMANAPADRNATYIGGFEAMSEKLSESFITPANADEGAEEGKILVRFTISAEGSVKSVKVIRSITPTMDPAIRAAVLALKFWEPAIQQGVPIESTVVVPFKVT